MVRRVILWVVVGVVMMAFLQGCAGSATRPSASKDSMVVVMSTDPGTLDPHGTVAQSHHQSTRQIYETLVVYDEKGKLVPWLAESWKYKDDVTLILHIRKGVKFHNGDELKAEDVLFTLNRIVSDKTPAARQVDQIDFTKSAVVDDYTVKLVTKGPYAIQLALLENPLCSIISKRAYTESSGDFSKAPIGTGPYKVVKYSSGDSLILEAFDSYWVKGQPYVKHLTIRYISDASSRAVEAESGGADIVYDISANDVDRIRANKNIKLVSAMGANTVYLTMNQAVKPLDDIRVREAIWYALDVPTAVKTAYGNYGQVATGIVSSE